MRLFVALPVPDPMKDALSPAMEGGPPGLRWIDEDQLHCTVRFVGEVDRHAAEDLARTFDGIPLPPVAAQVDGVGVFDHQRRGALFARLSPKAPLRALHERIDRLCIQCGLPPERRAYLPHVTMARWSGGRIDHRAWGERWAGLASRAMRFDRLVLYRSRLYRDGPVHEEIVARSLPD